MKISPRNKNVKLLIQRTKNVLKQKKSFFFVEHQIFDNPYGMVRFDLNKTSYRPVYFRLFTCGFYFFHA